MSSGPSRPVAEVLSLTPPAAGAAGAGVEASALELTLRALRPLLNNPEITELCINRPGEAFVETRHGWRCEPLPFATFEWCMSLAKLVANFTRQRVEAQSPILSASLPSGERIQIVLPPATTPGTVAITIRCPADAVWTLDELADRGIFRKTQRASDRLDDVESELVRLLDAKDYRAFLRLAVANRKNIVVSGPTGSGKTTFTKALIREIADTERLITIEDAKELVLDRHPNHVRLYYSKDDQGLAKTTPKQLLESCLRMKPNWILLAEVRGEEAFYLLRGISSGHPSITSIHAETAELTFEQFVLLVKQSAAGRELARADIKHLLYQLIDIVIQFGVHQGQRYIKEVWFDPERKRRSLAATV